MQAQSIDSVFVLAENSFERTNYANAINFYQRVLFFDSTNRYSAKIYEKLADAYFQEKEYQQAYFYYDLAFNTSLFKELPTSKISVKKAICAIHLADYHTALAETYNIPQLSNDSVRWQKQFLQYVSLYQLGKYEQAFNGFSELCDDSVCLVTVNKVRDQSLDLRRKSPKKARNLSIVFPGLGYYYIGEWKKGLNSTLLIGGLATLFTISAIQTTIFNAALNILPIYQRYYIGGYSKVELLAERKFEEKKQLLLREITIQF